jgi:MFS family permease
MAALFAILAIPLIRHLLRSDRVPQSSGTEDVQRGMVGRFWTRNDALKHWSFWLLLLWFALPSTFGTALFFHQVHIAEVKGWPFVYYVALIPFLTGGSIAATFAAGWAVDWLGANRVIALGLLPASLGFLILGEAQHLWVAAMALVVLGLTNGWVSTLGGAIWPELYGTRNIGAIRSIAMSAVVFGSAAGPAITGTLIDQGYMFEDQMPVISVVYLCYSLVIFLAMNRIRPSLMTATGHA